jgi:glycosyltransferase involved in cell wall biosynthesis
LSVTRLAVVVTHPIQYYAPLWRALAREPALQTHVIFASRIGLEKTFDAEMNTDVAWATDLTAGYSHEFLPEAASIKQTGFRVDNPSVGAALARFQPDTVILHGYGSRTLLRALVWCKLRGARALLTADSSAHAAAPGWRRTIKSLVAPLLLQRYDAALTMGDRGETHLASLGFPRARMFRMPVMIDEAFWAARSERERLRSERRAALGIAADAFVVLASSKLAPRKRIADLVTAFPGLGDNAVLLVAGDGEQRVALEALAAAKGVDARFLGFVNIDALPALYAAADVFAHAAENEQYGMVALEAAVVGLPLVLSDETGALGPTSIARPNENALVFQRGDVAALTTALRRLGEDVALRARMAAASVKVSQDHAGPESVAAVLAASSIGALRRSRGKAWRGDLPKG